MAWKYVGDGSSIPGIPATDLSDEEFEAYAKSYAENNKFPANSAEKSGLWKHEADGKKKAAASEGE